MCERRLALLWCQTGSHADSCTGICAPTHTRLIWAQTGVFALDRVAASYVCLGTIANHTSYKHAHISTQRITVWLPVLFKGTQEGFCGYELIVNKDVTVTVLFSLLSHQRDLNVQHCSVCACLLNSISWTCELNGSRDQWILSHLHLCSSVTWMLHPSWSG